MRVVIRLWHVLRILAFGGLALTFIVNVAQAQPVEDEEQLLRGTNRSISFTLDALSLGSLDGGVGGKYWLSTSTAFRGSVSFNVRSVDADIEQQTDGGRSEVGGGVSFIVERHGVSFRRVSPYLGAGFGIRGNAFSETTEFLLEQGGIQELRVKGSAVTFSILAPLGVEYYITPRISLAAEHVVGANVSIVTEEQKRSQAELPSMRFERNITDFSFGTGTSSLILSIYF